MGRLCLLLLLHLLLCLSGTEAAAKFTITNNCGYTIWPGILSSAGISPLTPTGFPLPSGASKMISAPTNWSGRLWARTHCTTDASNRFTCLSGDCGSGTVECSGAGATPPASLAEFTLSGANGMDFYDVSLVDGYNLPVLVVPSGGTAGNCTSTGCLVELNGACPSDLKVAGEVACKSACEAFGKDEFCCNGAYGNPNTCKPSAYSEFFKNACPRAYSYAYDDGTSTFTCAGADYDITFCPKTSSQKSAGENPQAAVPLVNSSMVYLGGEMLSPAATTSSPPSIILITITALLSKLLFLHH